MGNLCERNKSTYEASETTKGAPREKAAPRDDSLDGPRHEGSVLGLAAIGDKLISCADDKLLAVSSWIKDGKIPPKKSCAYLKGHGKAVNRVVAFTDASGTALSWSASRDLSIRCVSH
jgi:hypothetical protein